MPDIRENGLVNPGVKADGITNDIVVVARTHSNSDGENRISKAIKRPSLRQWGTTDAKAVATYLEGVPYKAGNWKNVIGTQKWLALYMQGLQGWLERLRLDIKKPNGDALFIAPASGSLDQEVKDGIVKRRKYPSSSRASNTANSEQAAKNIGGDSQATKNWWDIF